MWVKRAGFSLLAVAILASAPSRAGAAGDEIFRLTDPRGDDHGAGSLVYPIRDDLHAGDLDLLSLAARAEGDGTLFEATFARRIAVPDRRPVDVMGHKLNEVARYGFYTFNLDVYIDTDRVPGSGHLALLPGRNAEVDPSSAWEKAICLTPGPAAAHDMLKDDLKRFARRELKAREGRIDRSEMESREREIDRDVDQRVFFPTRVRVNGPTISFFVPGSFLGGVARATWSYVVAVTGADIYPRIPLTSAVGLASGVPDNLMVVPISSTPRKDRFGGADEEDETVPALVDILVPPGRSQEQILKEYDPANGRPVRLPGIVPAEIR
jgi:hypothetical protein